MRNYFVYKSKTTGQDRFMDIDAKCPFCGHDQFVLLTDYIKHDTGARIFFYCLGAPGYDNVKECGRDFYINFKNKGT